jgi:hypothetical protein
LRLDYLVGAQRQACETSWPIACAVLRVDHHSNPGFAVDEPIDRLREKLSLPPFLEAQRAQIESRLNPL